MRVADWYKWTRFKKRVGVTLIVTGIFVSFGMENGSVSYGLWGLLIAGSGSLIMSTIHRIDW